MSKKKPIKVKIKTRNWLAVHAHFKKAGAIKDKKKENTKKHCRTWKKDEE